MFTTRKISGFIAKSAAVATVAACASLLSVSAQALTIYIDQDATWRYINATAATTQTVDANWYTTGYDDSGWHTGVAPFSSGATSGTFGGDLGNVNGPYDPGTAPAIPGTFTQWDVNYDPYARIEFTLTEKTDLTVWMAVDNGINSMYLNGVLATASINAEGAAHRWEHVFDISADYTNVGTNVLALQLEDHGGATAFTLVLSGDDAAENPVFTENPPAVPAPGAVLLLGLSMIGLGAVRRRARR